VSLLLYFTVHNDKVFCSPNYFNVRKISGLAAQSICLKECKTMVYFTLHKEKSYVVYVLI
jgi:hypothetical protein